MSEPLADESFMRARLFGGDKSKAIILDGVPARVPHLEPEEPVEDAGLETLLTYRSGRV